MALLWHESDVTGRDWITIPGRASELLRFLGANRGRRKARLFAVTCCYSVAGFIADNLTGMRVNGLLMEAEQILSSTDVKNLAQAATAAAKLGEIDKTLAGLKGNGRLERARAYVRDQIKRVKLASLEAI